MLQTTEQSGDVAVMNAPACCKEAVNQSAIDAPIRRSIPTKRVCATRFGRS